MDPRTATLDRPRAAGAANWRRGVAVLAAVLVGLTAIRVLGPDQLRLADAAQDLVTLSVSVIIESLPFVVLGITLSVLVQLWVPDRVILAVLPTQPALRRVVLSLLGVVLPVCECGNVPLARGLIARGLTVPEAMTFLLAAPIVNPVTILTTFQVFGFDDGILVARIVGGFVIANLVGWMFSRHTEPERLLTPAFAASCRVHEHGTEPGGRMARSVRLFAAEASTMMPALFVGAGIAGLIQVAVSRETLVALGGNPLLSVLVMLALAFVVSMCSNVDAFFVLSLGSVFLPGAIVAFLVFGPMIDIKMLALLRTTFTARTLAIVTVVVALSAAALGLGMNLAP